MTKPTAIKATYQDVPFAETYISDLNPRKQISEESIRALADNIGEVGLIHPLGGLDEGQPGTGIVTGGRRHRALALLQDDPRFQTIPIHMAPDAKTAKIWASSENHQREQPHPADEISEYGAMAKDDIAVPAIAMAFGVTEAHVYRRLALANLHKDVLAALRAGEISLSGAAAFTICADKKRTLEVLEEVRGDGYNDRQIKNLLKPNSVRSNDRRVIWVGEDAYMAAGGRVGGDLFAEETLYDDPKLLDELLAKKLQETANAFCNDDGWKWCDIINDHYMPYGMIDEAELERIYPEPGQITEEEGDRYDELAELAEADALDDAGEVALTALNDKLKGQYSDAQKAVSGAIIHVNHQGVLKIDNGLVRPADKPAAVEAGFLQKSNRSAKADTPKSPISEKLRSDLGRMQTGARQNAALDDPTLVLHLLAFQLCGKMGHRKAFGLMTQDVPNMPDTETGFSLDKRLTTPEARPKDPWGSDLARGFAAFRKKGDKAIMDILNRYLVSQLTVSDDKLASMIDKATKKRTRDTFTPTAENFFNRVGGPYLNKIWRDLLGLAEDHPTATTFAKLKKADKADKLAALFADEAVQDALKLTKEQKDGLKNWLPEGME